MHSVSTNHLSGFSFKSDIDDYQLITDSSPSGRAQGPGPKKLMLASLAGCTGIDVVSILEKMKVSFTDFSIKIDATLSESHPVIYKEVKIRYTIKIGKEDEDKMSRAVKLSAEKYCGVMEMFRSFSTITQEINYL